MNPLYKAIAACPSCHGPLTWSADQPESICDTCGRRYPVSDSKPFMILETANRPTDPVATTPASWRHKLLQRTAPPGFSYKTRTSRSRIPRFVASLGPQAIVLNLGSGRTSFGPQVINLDIGALPNVDVVALGQHLPVGDACLDGVITQGVLEHVPDLQTTLAEIDRVLVPGGQVYHEIPFIQGYHASPNDYRRFTQQGIHELVAQYQVLDQGVAVGPSSAALWIMSEWLALLFSLGSRRLHRFGRRFFGWMLAPLKFLDAWLERYPHASLVACAFYIQARKPDAQP